jgi:1-acyl-sn-glycerol-3-phosphate acyltransferase
VEDPVQYRASRVVAGPFLHVLWRPEVTGLENIPETGGAVLASNHLSILDSIFLPLVVSRPVTFAAKSEYFTGTRLVDRVTAMYMRATNQLSVDRGGARAAQAMLEAALERVNGGALFGIYPEGTRSPDGRLYRGRTGIGWLALNSGVPVIPVAMIRSAWSRTGPMSLRTSWPFCVRSMLKSHGRQVAPRRSIAATRELTTPISPTRWPGRIVNRLAIASSRARARSRGVPWGSIKVLASGA